MPAVIGLAAGALVSGFVAEAVGTTVLGAAIGAIGSRVVGAIAGGVVSGVINNAMAPDAQVAQPSAGLEAQARGVMLNIAGNVEPIPLIYGSRRVGGPRILTEVSGDTNQYLHVVIVLGEGPVAAINTVYLDDTPSDDPRFSTFVTVEKHLGDDAQAASAALIAALPGQWSSADTLSGIAYLYVKLQYQQTAFPNGLPVITADVDGRTLYDPRDAGTRFSNNPALVIRDYLTNTRYGKGIPTASIDDTAFNTAANHCDERVTVAAHLVAFTADPDTDLLAFYGPQIFLTGDKVQVSTTGTLPAPLAAATNYYVIRCGDSQVRLATSYANAMAGTYINITTGGTPVQTMSHIDIARYTCDGVINVDQSPLDNYRSLLTCCRGYAVFSGGKHKLVIDKAETPLGFEFTEDNIVGAWTIQPASKRTQVNRVKAQYFNPSLRWQPDLEVFDSSAHRTLDNGLVLETQIQLPFTASKYRVNQIAQLEERQSRVGIVAKFRATVAGIQCEVGDVVPITHSTPGWVAQPYRVMRIELLNSDEVDVTVRQYDAGVYSFTTPGEFTPAAATNLPNPFTIMRQVPPNVSGLEIVNAPSVNRFAGRDVKFAWRRQANTGAYEFGSEPWGSGGLHDWYFKDFKVEIRHDLTEELLRTDYVTDPYYTYTYEHNVEDGGGTPTRYVQIRVWQRTKYDQVSAIRAQLSAQNPQALLPTLDSLRANFKNIWLSYTPAADTDWGGIVVWKSITPSFSTADTVAGQGNCAYVGTDPTVVLDASPQLLYYIQFAAFDTFGKDWMITSPVYTVLTDAVQTADVAASAITRSSGSQQSGSISLVGTVTGSLAAPVYTEDVATGVIATLAPYAAASDMLFQWGISFGTGGTNRLQLPKMDRLEYDAGYSVDLGSCSIALGTFGGYNCLVLTCTNTPAAANVSAGSNTTAIVTIAGQPYLYVQSIDVANKKIYCTPNSTASAGEAWLVGAGAFPLSKNAKLWGQAGSSAVLNRATGSFITALASVNVSVSKTEFGNMSYGSYSEAFSLACRAFLTSAGDTASDGFVVVNNLKR